MMPVYKGFALVSSRISKQSEQPGLLLKL